MSRTFHTELSVVAMLRLAAAMALALCGCQVESRPPQSACAASQHYTAMMVLDAVHGAEAITANGLPLLVTTGPGSMLAPGATQSRDLTSALVSDHNEVVFSVAPAVTQSSTGASGSEPPESGPVAFRARVCSPSGGVAAETRAATVDSLMVAWDAELRSRWPRWQAAEDSAYAARPALRDSFAAVAAHDPSWQSVGVGVALDAARAWARAHPVRVVARFTRPGGARPSDGQPSFDAVLRDAPAIRGTVADSVRLRAFAVELGRKRVARDTAAVWDALAYALGREFVVSGGQARLGVDSLAFMSEARRHIVTSDVFPFEAEDVELTSWAGGRVWELSLRGQRGLLVHPEVAAGRSGTMRRISVGVGPNGELRVVWAS